MSTSKTSVLLAGLLAVSAGYAQTTANTAPSTVAAPMMNKDAAKVAKDRIEETAKADKKACDGLKDNAKDICQAEAKAKEKVALAELKFQETGKDSDRVKLAEVRAETAYDVAKERCEDQQGDARSACKKQAKETEKSALADAKKSAKS